MYNYRHYKEGVLIEAGSIIRKFMMLEQLENIVSNRYGGLSYTR